MHDKRPDGFGSGIAEASAGLISVPDWGASTAVNLPQDEPPEPSPEFVQADAAWQAADAAHQRAQTALAQAREKVAVYQTAPGVVWQAGIDADGWYGSSPQDVVGQELKQDLGMRRIARDLARSQVEIAWHTRHQAWQADARRVAAAYHAGVVRENQVAFDARQAEQRGATKAEKDRRAGILRRLLTRVTR